MTTIAISYNENNNIARKAIDFILALGVFKVHNIENAAKRRTLKTIENARKGKDVIQCATFEDYLKAVAE